VRVVLDSQALELGGLAGEHLRGAHDLVVHVGGLRSGSRREHALEGVLHVVRGQRGAIVALDALLQGAVQRDAVVLKRRNLGQKVRDELDCPRSSAAVRQRWSLHEMQLESRVCGLLHVQTLLCVGLAKAQNLLLLSCIFLRAGARAGSQGRRCSSASCGNSRTLKEAATRK
jgi:hypothetical protein